MVTDLPCPTQRNAQTCQPEKLKHGIFLVRKCKISCHPGEDLILSLPSRSHRR